MESRKNERTETTRGVILRMSNAVENAPYALESAKVLDVKLASSCIDPTLPGIRLAASCVMDETDTLTPVEPPSKSQK